MNTIRELTDKELDAVSGGTTGLSVFGFVPIETIPTAAQKPRTVPPDLVQAQRATQKLDIPVRFDINA
jgi:bacteriocin-like protein